MIVTGVQVDVIWLFFGGLALLLAGILIDRSIFLRGKVEQKDLSLIMSILLTIKLAVTNTANVLQVEQAAYWAWDHSSTLQGLFKRGDFSQLVWNWLNTSHAEEVAQMRTSMAKE